MSDSLNDRRRKVALNGYNYYRQKAHKVEQALFIRRDRRYAQFALNARLGQVQRAQAA